MNEKDIFSLLLRGFTSDLLTVLLSAILPMLVGVGLTVLMHFTRKTALPKVFRYVAIVTESLVPAAVLYVLFYVVLASFQQADLPVVVTLNICFMGYMAFHYDERDSLLKNIVVNAMGLIIKLYLWCVAVSGMLGATGLLRSAQMIMWSTYKSTYFLVPLLVSFGVLFVLHILRQLCKDFMK